MSQNTDFSLLWSQHMVSYINLHHKSASKYFHKNSSSEYCIHVDLTIVTILLKNVGVISNCSYFSKFDSLLNLRDLLKVINIKLNTIYNK